MIDTITYKEKDYRDVKMDSSSSVKDFSLDRRKYFRKYMNDEQIEEKDSQFIVMGQLVELLLWEPDLFDEKFYMSSCVNIPTAGMLKFVEALYVHTKAAEDEFGVVQATFEDLAELAYVDSEYKISKERVIKNFAESDAMVYFEEICTVRSNNLQVVDPNDVSNAERIVAELKSNPTTAEIVNQETDALHTVLDQHKIIGYEVLGHKVKSMVDRIIISHKKMSIQVYDLKCTWNVEDFYWAYYLKRRSYIQGLFYYTACTYLRDNTPEYAGYTVELPKFIVCDSINYYSPLIYTMDEIDMRNALKGFTHSGRNYPGVSKILDDLSWAKEHDNWTIARITAELGGVINLRHES